MVKETRRSKDWTLYTGSLGTAFLLLKSYLVTKDAADLSLCAEIVGSCEASSRGSSLTPTLFFDYFDSIVWFDVLTIVLNITVADISADISFYRDCYKMIWSPYSLPVFGNFWAIYPPYD